MSTKTTIYHDDQIHVYQEAWDESAVHIKSDASNPVFTYSLTLKQACGLAQAMDLESLKQQALLSDQQIRKYCHDTVMERVGNSHSFSAMFGMLVFGDHEDPVELQIERGFKFYKDRRDQLKEVYDALFGGPRKYGTRFQFGLEEII